jgi:hypothetical protein
VTSTLPDALRDVARSHQELRSRLLFQASSAALNALIRDPKHLGGQIGMVGVLQTWSRDRASHPPGHDLVPGGALSPDDRPWLAPRDRAWRVPVKALSKRFRREFKDTLTTAGLIDHVPPQGWKKKCRPR